MSANSEACCSILYFFGATRCLGRWGNASVRIGHCGVHAVESKGSSETGYIFALGFRKTTRMVKALVRYKVLNIIEKRQPISLSFTKHEILAEYESARDADLTFRNLIARIPDGVTILNPTKNTIEVTL